MKFTASSEKFFEDRIPGVKVPPGHWVEKKKEGRFRVHHLVTSF